MELGMKLVTETSEESQRIRIMNQKNSLNTEKI